MKNNKSNQNYLNYIPIRNPKFAWKFDQNKMVVVEVERTGLYDKIAQKIFRVPAKSDIELDEYGSFIWLYINGQNTIFDISKEVSNKFKENAEPLLPRLIKFFQILYNNKFIMFDNNLNK